MTTVLFIHGTGTRDPEFTMTFDRVKRRLTASRPDLNVEPCYWGHVGAKLLADGDSFAFDKARGKSDRKTEVIALSQGQEVMLWKRLMANPLYEIRIRQIKKPPAGRLGPSLKERMVALPRNQRLEETLRSLGLTAEFQAAVADVTGSPDFTAALGEATTTDGDTVRMLSRALVAHCLATASAAGVDLAGEHRDQLVDAIVAAFGVADQGPGERMDELMHWAAGQATGWGMHPFVHNRRRRSVEQFADVVLYQARGCEIRDIVSKRIREFAEPVVLLAHSLGGVIAFDLLAEDAAGALGNVKMLVTVGSQVPLLYEIGALTCRVGYPAPLPPHFTAKWVNVYDQRDLLAYAGAGLLQEYCSDIPVNTRTPFPAVHGAYWDSSHFYRELHAVMQAEWL